MKIYFILWRIATRSGARFCTSPFSYETSTQAAREAARLMKEVPNPGQTFIKVLEVEIPNQPSHDQPDEI